VYLPTGHRVLAFTHVMPELQEKEICVWQQKLAHHLKMMSELWCPSVHVTHIHAASFLKISPLAFVFKGLGFCCFFLIVITPFFILDKSSGFPY